MSYDSRIHGNLHRVVQAFEGRVNAIVKQRNAQNYNAQAERLWSDMNVIWEQITEIKYPESLIDSLAEICKTARDKNRTVTFNQLTKTYQMYKLRDRATKSAKVGHLEHPPLYGQTETSINGESEWVAVRDSCTMCIMHNPQPCVRERFDLAKYPNAPPIISKDLNGNLVALSPHTRAYNIPRPCQFCSANREKCQMLNDFLLEFGIDTPVDVSLESWDDTPIPQTVGDIIVHMVKDMQTLSQEYQPLSAGCNPVHPLTDNDREAPSTNDVLDDISKTLDVIIKTVISSDA